MSINKKLEELYSSKWEQFIQNSKNINPEPTNPLLLKVDEEKLEKADIKVMIFGQETRGWHKLGKNIEDGMNGYHKFFVEKNFYSGYKKSSFWKAFRFFEMGLNEHYLDKDVVFIWNNISKIGKNDGKTGVTKEIRELERNYFNVIQDELSIIKPDITIFFTGNRYSDVQYNFKDIEYTNIPMNNLKKSKRKYKNAKKLISKKLPEKSVKLYHPSYFGGFNYTKYDALNFLKES